MAILPGADTSRILHGFKKLKRKCRGIVIHIAVSESAFPFYGAGLGAEFYVRKSGSVAQQIDTKYQGGHALDGNGELIGVESQGGVHNANGEEWTPQQCESIAQVIAWSAKTHGFPIKPMQNSDDSGVGWHRRGVDGNFPAGLLGGRLQTGGKQKWSKARGKICPGDAKIRQMPGIIARAQQIAASNGYGLHSAAPVVDVVATPTGSAHAGNYYSRGGLNPAQYSSLQAFLNRSFPSYSNLKVDGLPGPASYATIKEFQSRVGIDADGIPGPITQGKLAGFGWSADGLTVVAANAAAAPAPTPIAPKFPLPAGSYFGPKSGPASSVSGFYSHRSDLQTWQQRMKDRGWGITVDGYYGPKTAEVTRLFQKEKGLDVDGRIGPATWAAAWTAPIT